MIDLQKHRAFKASRLGTGYTEPGMAKPGQDNFQCVGGVKQYSKEVLGVSLKAFGGTAITGWNTGSPFKGLPFKKILNTASFIPQVGDICFFDKGSVNKYCGHTAIVDEYATVTKVPVLNQNAGNGNGRGSDDMWKVTVFDYIHPTKFLGVYRKI